MSARSYFRLDRRILSSSVWARDPDLLKVWLFLLLQADSRGRVEAVPPMIAASCGIAVARVREILEELASPDPDSRTPTDEGRRIRIEHAPEYAITLVNAEKYSAMTYRQAAAERQRRYRQRKRDVTRDVTRNAGDVTRDAGDVIRIRMRMRENLSASSDAGGDSTPSPGRGKKRPNPGVKALVDHYLDEYQRIYGAKPVITGATARAAQALLAGRGLAEAQRIITEYLESPPSWQRDRGLLDLRHVAQAANTILARGVS